MLKKEKTFEQDEDVKNFLILLKCLFFFFMPFGSNRRYPSALNASCFFAGKNLQDTGAQMALGTGGHDPQIHSDPIHPPHYERQHR